MREASRCLDLMACDKAAEEIARARIAIVPIGALEPHGRHAPLGADTFIANEIAERLAAAVDAVVFPPMPLGAMNVVYDFRYMPGTISLDPKLLIALYTNIGTELARSGVLRIIFVNAHGPNSAMLNVAAYQIRDQAAVEVGILEWWTTAEEHIKEIKGFGFGCHGDEIETSLMLATEEAELVDLSAAIVNSERLEQLSPGESALYRAKVPFTRTWDERWIGSHGNMGDPTKATKEKGDRIIARAVQVGVQLAEVLSEQHKRAQSRAAKEPADKGIARE
jgi:creatinine amidohydrolase